MGLAVLCLEHKQIDVSIITAIGLSRKFYAHYPQPVGEASALFALCGQGLGLCWQNRRSDFSTVFCLVLSAISAQRYDVIP